MVVNFSTGRFSSPLQQFHVERKLKLRAFRRAPLQRLVTVRRPHRVRRCRRRRRRRPWDRDGDSALPKRLHPDPLRRRHLSDVVRRHQGGGGGRRRRVPTRLLIRTQSSLLGVRLLLVPQDGGRGFCGRRTLFGPRRRGARGHPDVIQPARDRRQRRRNLLPPLRQARGGGVDVLGVGSGLLSRRRRRRDDSLVALEVGGGRGDGLVVVQVREQVAKRLGQRGIFGRADLAAADCGLGVGGMEMGMGVRSPLALGMVARRRCGLEQRGGGAQLPLSWLWDGSLF